MSQVANDKHLHYLIAEKLLFTKFYGSNWDAVWDEIIGNVKMPNELILYNWTQFEKKLPIDAKTLKEFMGDFNNELFENRIIVKADNTV